MHGIIYLFISTLIGVAIFFIGLGLLAYAYFSNNSADEKLKLKGNASNKKHGEKSAKEQKDLKQKMLIIEKNLNSCSTNIIKFKKLVHSYLDTFGLIHEFAKATNAGKKTQELKNFNLIINLINKRIAIFFNTKGYKIIYPKLGDDFNHELMEVVRSTEQGKKVFSTDRPGLYSQEHNILFKAKVVLD